VWYDKGYNTITGTFPPFTDEYNPEPDLFNGYIDAPIFLKLRNAEDFLRIPAHWDDLRLNKTTALGNTNQNSGYFSWGWLTLGYSTWQLSPALDVAGNLHCFGEGEQHLLRMNDEVWYTFNGPAWVLRAKASFTDDSWSPSAFEVTFAKFFTQNCVELGHPSAQLVTEWDAYDVVTFGAGPAGEPEWPFVGDTLPYGMGTNTLYEWATPEIEIVDNPFP